MSASTGSAARYALIIGVNRAADPGLAALQSAESDARALAAALAAPECGFAVTTLIGADATATGIRKQIIELHIQALQQPPDLRPDLLIAFCGHGVPVALKAGGHETFLATVDFQADHAAMDNTRFLSLRWLYQQVYEAAEPRSVAIVLDCCFAGDIFYAGKDALIIYMRKAIEQYKNEGRADPVSREWLRAIITATSPGEAAGETAAGGLLTQALLRVLRGEELIGDGEVTIGRIDEWLKQQFANQATQKPFSLITGNHQLKLADYRARRTAAEQQRRREEALALIARWRARDSLARAVELQTGFVGRVQELEDIRQHIAQLRPDGGYLLVTGVAGQGKSSILAQLLKDADPPIPAYFIRFTPGPAEQAALIGHLVAELLLQNGLAEEASTYLSDAANAITLRNSLVSPMERLSHERPLTLVIDGLDQIPVDYGIGQRDLSFLPERLPEGVVVVIGTRPDDTLVPLKLLTPCREYQLPPLSLNDFAALLAQRGVTLSEGDRQALHAALHGNAFDLAFLAGELQREPGAADAQALIRRVIANPKDIFTPTLERLRCDRLFWRDVLRPMLGVLLAAQEPLSQAALSAILNLPFDDVGEGITRLRGLLGERERNGRLRYSLLHLKLIDYLRRKVFPGNAFILYHDRLARWSERDLERLWQATNDLREAERRSYAQSHLVTHLAAARAYERLWALLDADEYGAAKWRADPSLRRFAIDLDVARDAVIAAADGDVDALARQLPRLWRYSLLRCSLTSQIDNWPTELFTALVALGRSDEACDHAGLLSDPKKRADVLTAIGTALLERNEQTAAVEALRQARAAAGAIPADDWRRAAALDAVAQALARAGRVEEARTVIEAISDDRYRAAALGALAAALVQAGQVNEADAGFAEARAAAETISDDGIPWGRAEALSAVAQALAQAGRVEEAYAAAEAIPDILGCRARALSDLATMLARAGRVEEARAVAAAIRYADDRVEALGNLAAALARAGRVDEADAVFAKARAIATAITDARCRAEALGNLASALTQARRTDEADAVFAEARAAAAIRDDAWHNAGALDAVARALAQAGRFEEAHAVAGAIPVAGYRARALGAVAKALAQAGRFEEAHAVAVVIPDANARAAVLAAVAAALAQAGQTDEADAVFAEACTAATRDEVRRHARALGNLAAALTQARQTGEADAVFAALRATVESIPDEGRRAAVLGAVAAALAQAGQTDEADKVFAKVHAAAEAIHDVDDRAKALGNLATALAQTGRIADAVRLLAESWLQAQTREELLQLFAIDAALIRAYPEIGMGFVEGFQWVDTALARG